MIKLLTAHRRSRRGSAGGRRPPRRGFSLVEVMVAMTMLSIILLSLAKLSTVAGVRGRTNGLVAKRSAALQLEANKFDAIPFDSLGSVTSGTTTDSTLKTFAYKRRLTITKPLATRYSIKIVILPLSDTTRKDSLSFERTRPPSGTPLCVGC